MLLLQRLADFLSLLTIGMSFMLKIPQILNLLSTKSADQISIASLLLELTNYTVMTNYHYANGYSILTYLECPVLLVQEYILIFLVLKYLKKINTSSVLVAALYFAISSCFALQIVPKVVLTFLAPACTPISVSSKIVQLLVILRAKNADTVSPTTWFISAFTNLTRIFTIWMDSADLLLLGNFTVNTICSSSIMFSAIYYRSHRLKED